ncbi:restriction endonuclease subunit S [Pontibacter harenae]|uniref:restriction endonuclease subunit S n=1 Tax=Pontibacter harenae TaxID=2894083 RepID=UPI001E46FF2D|nr:restriction endonuclease subunit S [Pontibacter harenae]MCC9168130.1 restriction endonuclease subunit S [Pontibacter harenae]
MLTNFDTKPFPECVFFQEGPGLRNWQWTQHGMKVINVTNILGDGSINISNTDKYISEVEFETKYSHFLVDEGDIVVASSGNTYGKIGRIKSEHLPLMMNTSVIRFRSLNTEALDNNYLYCYLRSPLFKHQIEQFVTGGAQPNFGPTHVKKMFIDIPPISIQRRIGKIVGAYDDLIENNLKRIALLEKSARLLYEEWFVRLRFPGYEHTNIVDGVPEGWEKKKLGDTIILNYGKALKESDRVAGDFPVYGSSGVVGTNEKALVEGPAIIVGRKGNVGSVYWSDKNCWPIDTVYYISCEETNLHLYFALQYLPFINSDAAVPGLNRNHAYNLDVVLPSKTISEAFDELVKPMHNQILKLQYQNYRLKQARAILLPKLINGEITV